MAPIGQHFQMHFVEWKYMNFDQSFTEVCPKGPISNILALVQITAWQWPGDKPFSELTRVRLDYRRINASLGLNELTWKFLNNQVAAISF